MILELDFYTIQTTVCNTVFPIMLHDSYQNVWIRPLIILLQTLNNICTPFLCVFQVCSWFLGEYCQHKDPCYVGYCLNGGGCTVSVAGVPGSPSCDCPLGFAGQRCEIQKNSTCYPNNPCTNGGKCSLLPNDQYQCVCARGWTGQSSLLLPISISLSLSHWDPGCVSRQHFWAL